MPTEGSEAIAGTAAKPATEQANAVKVAMVDEEHGDAMVAARVTEMMIKANVVRAAMGDRPQLP